MRYILQFLRTIPHRVLFRRSDRRDAIIADLERWRDSTAPDIGMTEDLLVYTLAKFPEYRNLFYYRLRKDFRGSMLLYLATWLCRPFPVLFLESTLEIGPGLFIQHGTCSHIGAQRIGKNCWINQQVTIGWRFPGKSPVLGDNVYVGAGAKILGEIRVGSNVRIGANAVVIEDVPDDSTVVGVPARIVKRETPGAGTSTDTGEVT